MSQNKANDAAKLRIRKESDFNITEFFRIICVFFGDNSCGFNRILYLCRIILIRINQKKL